MRRRRSIVHRQRSRSKIPFSWIAKGIFYSVLITTVISGCFIGMLLLSFYLPLSSCSQNINGIKVTATYRSTIKSPELVLTFIYPNKEKITHTSIGRFPVSQSIQECFAVLNRLYVDERYLMFFDEENALNTIFAKRINDAFNFSKAYMYFDRSIVNGYGIKTENSSQLVTIDHYLKTKFPQFRSLENLRIHSPHATDDHNLEITITGDVAQWYTEYATSIEIKLLFDPSLQTLLVVDFTVADQSTSKPISTKDWPYILPIEGKSLNPPSNWKTREDTDGDTSPPPASTYSFSYPPTWRLGTETKYNHVTRIHNQVDSSSYWRVSWEKQYIYSLERAVRPYSDGEKGTQIISIDRFQNHNDMDIYFLTYVQESCEVSKTRRQCVAALFQLSDGSYRIWEGQSDTLQEKEILRNIALSVHKTSPN